MTDQEILKKAAQLNAKKSWDARVKKWGGVAAAREQMRRVRKGEKLRASYPQRSRKA